MLLFVDYIDHFQTIDVFHQAMMTHLIVYIKGSQAIIFKTKSFHNVKVDFALANSAGHDVRPPNAAFYLGIHCLPTYWLRGFCSAMG